MGTHDPAIAEALAAIDFIPGVIVASEAGEAISGCNFLEGLWFELFVDVWYWFSALHYNYNDSIEIIHSLSSSCDDH